MSLTTRLQVLLAVCCLMTGHPAALVATPALLGLIALRALARQQGRQQGQPTRSRGTSTLGMPTSPSR